MSTPVKASEGGVYLHLPIDILSEILVRLPVKSLLRFKSVCKHWYSLIKSPSFVSKHLHRPTADDGVSPVIFLREWAIYLSLLCEDTLSIAADYEVPYPVVAQRFCEFSEIVGSCNGLVVVAHSVDFMIRNKIFLWNPATRLFRRLPKPLFNAKTTEEDHCVGFFYGFWCASETPLDHRLLRILQLYGGDLLHYDIEIYSQGTDSWRVVDAEFPTECILISHAGCAPALVVNGSLHWAGYGGKGENTVIAFDCNTEMFREIQVPDGSKQCRISLVLYQEECLGLAMIPGEYDQREFHDVIEVWVMKEYGIHESWTKRFSFDYFVHADLRLQGCFRNGGIVMYGGVQELVLYDPSTGLFQDISIEGYGSCNLTLRESLVSIEASDAAC